MAIGESIPVIIGAGKEAGSTAQKSEADDRDKMDFGAELGAILTALPPLASSLVKAGPAASSGGDTLTTGNAQAPNSIAPGVGAGSNSRASIEPATTKTTPAKIAAAATATTAALPPPVASNQPTRTSAGTASPTDAPPPSSAATVATAPVLTIIAQSYGTTVWPAEADPTTDVTTATFAETSFAGNRTAIPQREVLSEGTGTPVAELSTPIEINTAIKEPSGKQQLVKAGESDQAPSAKAPGNTNQGAENGGHAIQTGSANSSSAASPIAEVYAVSPVVIGALVTPSAPAPLHIQPTANAGPTPPAVSGQGGQIAPPVAVASIRQLVEVPVAPVATHTAALKVDLADGSGAQATVRERAGSVEVRIVTNSSPAVQHLVSQIGGLRRALDATGLRLNSADVSYRGEGGERNQGDGSDQTPRRDAQSQNVFDIYEADQ